MKFGAVIQARTTSKRFPRKILQPMPHNSTLTVLDQVIRRVKKSKFLNEIIIATTTNFEDNEVIVIAERNMVSAFRGSENDVLDRYYQASMAWNLDAIVRITSDCPCIDWNVIDIMIEEFKTNKYDYFSNGLKKTYPRGLDIEIFTFQALKEAFEEAKRPKFREHVTPYLYMTKKFRIGNFEAPSECFSPEIRITLDTSEDYALICAVFDFLYFKNPEFSCRDIINLFNEKPWLNTINRKIMQKKTLNSLEEEIKEAIKVLELQDLNKAKDFLILKYNERKEN